MPPPPLYLLKIKHKPLLPRYLRSEECRVEEELLIAFKDYRPDLLRKVQGDRTLHRLETAIVRLAKSLRVSGDEEDEEGVCVFLFSVAGV